jgi:hypothetical protein
MGKHFLFIMMGLFFLVPSVYAADFHKGSLFKITFVAENEEVDCEYKFPSDYRCEKNGNELADKKARKQLLLFYQQLHIHPGVKAEEMVANLQNNGYKNVQFLDVRWIDEHGRLFTWIWDKDKQ